MSYSDRIQCVLEGVARGHALIDFRELAAIITGEPDGHRNPDFRAAIVDSGFAPLVIYREHGCPGLGYFQAKSQRRPYGREEWRADVERLYQRADERAERGE